MYIWQLPDWPNFRWDSAKLLIPLANARHRQGRLLGTMARLGFPLQREAELQALTEEVVKTADIEGEQLRAAGVRSSLARRLGLPDAGLAPPDSKAEGLVETMLDATRNYRAPLTAERLFGWQAALFPTGRSGLAKIKTGDWRDDAAGPMEVVSGPVGRQRVHYQAPPAARLVQEMRHFLAWFAAGEPADGLLRSALAHFWFVTIHPFEDGNGRIARAIAEMALAQSEDSPQRFYSMSSQISRERSRYYEILEAGQTGDLDLTDWLVWCAGCFERAIAAAESQLESVRRRADFWQRHAQDALNERQRKLLDRLLDDFAGKLTAKKWAALTKCSIPTAQRDIKELVERGLLSRNEGGSKNTSYSIVDPSPPRE